MDKNAIKRYAMWAREELIKRVSTKALEYGISEKSVLDESANAVGERILTSIEKSQRTALITKIKENGFEHTIEEVAYTWFNRFIALRFMEVNGYLPSKVRVFTDEENNFKPQILDEAIHMELDGLNLELVMTLKEENKTDELYKYLLITQCNALHGALPQMFAKANVNYDYTLLLFPDNIRLTGSVIEQMITIIPEDDWKDEVEIIGWLYQFYNTELNALVYDGKMSKSRIEKELLPAATTMYTPDWAIKYMVENSLGRIAVEKLNINPVQMGWKYYLPEAEQTVEVQEQLKIINGDKKDFKLEELKLIDPCMGSGHILVYAFDLLMQIYENQGYTIRDAVSSIIENNLYGLDISERAYQLAYFAIMMRARKYDRRFFSRDIAPQIYCPQGYEDGKEYGSIIKINELEEMPQEKEEITLFSKDYSQELNDWNFRRLVCQKYDVVITNPPYLGNSRFSPKLDKYIKENYVDVKSDLSAVMLKKAVDDMCKVDGYVSFITTSSWMFLSSFEKLRKYLLTNCCFTSIVDFGTELFDGKVGHNPIVAWVNRKTNINTNFIGVRLVDYCYSRRDEKEPEFFNNKNHYVAQQENFSKIPGSPIAYWVSEKFISNFKNGTNLKEFSTNMTAGNKTAENERFLRRIWEINSHKLNNMWVKYAKGGSFRKWYGNIDFVIDWSDTAKARYKQNPSACVVNDIYQFKKGFTYTDLTSKAFSCRLLLSDMLFDMSGPGVLFENDNLNYTMGIFNSNVANNYFMTLNTTFHFKLNDLIRIPIIINETKKEQIDQLVTQNISISKTDWDAFETSWDFEKHPLLNGESIKSAFENWENDCNDRFNTLKANEEELNRIFIEIYGLEDELTPEVLEKDVTVRKADLARDIKSFISYAVGCMFGRYSLDVDGLAFAGGDFDESKYITYKADKDNIIPICDDEYFEDDIVGKFIEFVKVVYGETTLEENLAFIAQALGSKGTAREVIRNYFLNGFYADHCKMYQKRPIYWQVESAGSSSGSKQNGFKALIYMHRYEQDTMARMRTDYVHEQQGRYRTAIADLEHRIAGVGASEKIKLSKQLTKLKDQETETRLFEEKIHHLADQMIRIDLDDGVKNNYEIFKDVVSKIK